MVPPPPAFTTGAWSWGGGGAVQAIEKLAGVVLPAVTATVCGLASLTLQLDGIGLSSTEWYATLRPLNVTPPLAATDWVGPAATVTVYASGSRSEPEVLVVTLRAPVVAAQVTENAVGTVWPAMTDTVCVSPPFTVQLAATPDRTTGSLPADRLMNVTPSLLLVGIDWLLPAST